MMVLGPLTVKQLDLLREAMENRQSGFLLTPANVASGCMWSGLEAGSKVFGLPMPDGLMTCYD